MHAFIRAAVALDGTLADLSTVLTLVTAMA